LLKAALSAKGQVHVVAKEMKSQIIVMVLLALLCHWADAAVPGRITLTNDQSVAGMIVWQPEDGTYRVLGSTLVIPPNKIKQILVKKPDQLELALKLIERGEYTKPIPILEKLVEQYTMLQWDQPAYRWLAECYLRTGQPRKVLKVYAKSSSRVAHPHPDILPFYLQALLDLGQLDLAQQLAEHLPPDQFEDFRHKLKDKAGGATTKPSTPTNQPALRTD